jgi:DNA-binding MarR family transcriptional regulator
MGGVARLAEEIKMTKPFSLLEEEATLSLVRTADVLFQRAGELLKPFDISPAQYNVLRILRGAKEALACGQIAERMVSRDPDITRLLDRMERRGLITRARDGQDRRVVKTEIHSKGLRLLEEIDPIIAAHHQRQFAGFGEKKLRQLVEWMDQIRESGQKGKSE